MPTPAQDLNDKLKLEAKLRPELRRYNRQLLLDYRATYSVQGLTLNIKNYDEELTRILRGHYLNVRDVFGDRISPELPDDLAVTDNETRTIQTALAAFFLTASSEHARTINGTTQDQAEQSIAQAIDDELVKAETGRDAQITAATLATVFLGRKLADRMDGILATETQLAAETSKATEAEVLSGLEPSITAGQARQPEIVKEWVSVGDSDVRPGHLTADGQTRKINTPFTVSGESLRWPGDSSLGASIGNIINCRCSAQYNTPDILEARR